MNDGSTNLISPKRLQWSILGAAIIFLVLSAAVHSPSVDESAHLAAGLSHWELGSFELYAVNPPLTRLVAALPVQFMSHRDAWDGIVANPSRRPEFVAGAQLVQCNGADSQWMFFAGRVTLLFFFCLLAAALRHWVTMLVGPQVAVTALCLLVCSTSMLGNASMLTPDMGAAAMGLTAMLAFREWLLRPSVKLAALVGVPLGLALLAKATWFLVLPMAVLIIVPFWRSNGMRLNVIATNGPIAIVVAVAIVNLGYGFEHTGTALRDLTFISNSFQELNMERDLKSHKLGFLQSVPIPLPSAYILGMDVQKFDFERRFRSYLMGEWKHGGWWYYYLIGFLVKEPIGFQLMLYASVGHGLCNWKRCSREAIREWSLIVTPPLVIFGLVSSQTGFNHHMRYVLPAYPFLFIIAARTVTLGKFWKWFSYACMTWQAAAVLWFAPHWMSYFNEFAGGPKNGHKWLVDSNIDWGQDILMLKWWQDKHPESAPLSAAMFTGFDPKDIGLKYKLPAPFVKGQPEIVNKDGLRGPQPGWYAVSVSVLNGLHFTVPEGNGDWSSTGAKFTYFLDNFEPVDMIGYSIYIYHITEEDAARVRVKLLAEEAEVFK